MPRAPKPCGRNGCKRLVYPPRKHCEACSGWNTSPQTASSQATGRHRWRAVVRPAVLRRDGYQCQLRFPGICVGRATEVDHVREVSDGGVDSVENGIAVCIPCHRRKTAKHAARASHTNR
ncbi:HNH endonuclease [Mycobacterium sp. 852014-52144_SCH5372336]|uniref:HNH endonuclease n=1 Tax=Mycobacterium sp. 852014-52144_SCH5372336 TaxID=1834115 RepID=UPI0007FD2D9B|nr:HNH endonuclease signature motif containing protein [Mycobacterium sp. 852014-52144_SCH5372336]OBB76808.1 HNH endonuclease [Mycobacterium sp. 852014-52144_SCH5372336]